MFLAKFFVSSMISLALFSGSISPVFADDNVDKGSKGHHSSKALEYLVTQGNLTQVQVNAFKNAMRVKKDEKFSSRLDTVLTDLANKNLLTQAKVDLIKASALSKQEIKDLVASGSITKAEAQLVQSSLKALPKEERSILRDQVLSDLVTKQIITQSQADAIKNVKHNWVKKSGKHRKIGLVTSSDSSLIFK
jgi:hypothetical protein